MTRSEFFTNIDSICSLDMYVVTDTAFHEVMTIYNQLAFQVDAGTITVENSQEEFLTFCQGIQIGIESCDCEPSTVMEELFNNVESVYESDEAEAEPSISIDEPHNQADLTTEPK